jgi:hypothetical protein
VTMEHLSHAQDAHQRLNSQGATYHRRALPITVEDLAVTALVRILPRRRYRLAAQNDARFQSFASNTSRIAYRQQGATPAFLLFSGPGQNPHSAALAAASWAEANWRPNAIQRSVRPGVVVVHVAPGNQLTPSGPVAGAAVPAAVWTVDSASGKVETVGKPPGSPSPGDIRSSATSLIRGEPAPSLGQLDLAERGVMQLRTVAMTPALGIGLRLLLFIFALRYGIGGLFGLIALPSMLNAGKEAWNLTTLTVGLSVLLLAGIVFGAAVIFNFRNMAYTTPGLSSPASGVRNLTWGAYIVAMIGLAVVYDGVLPQLERQSLASMTPAVRYTHVKASVNDDGGETFVRQGGDLTVDLSGWPSSEWSGVQFKSSNPSVLVLDSTQADQPVAKFSARETGVSRVDASSKDGKYSFEVRVDVGTASEAPWAPTRPWTGPRP